MKKRKRKLKKTGMRHRFFQQMFRAAEGVKPEKVIHSLIDEMSFFKSAFEDELERVPSAGDKEGWRKTIRRHVARLTTLDRMKKNLPVSAKSLELLLEYGNNRELPELAGYTRVLYENPQDGYSRPAL